MAGLLRTTVAGAFLLFFYFISCAYGKDEIKIPENQNQVLTEENWQKILEGEWMVKFFAPWCPACRHVGPTWLDLASWSARSEWVDLSVGEVDVTKQSALSGRFMVSALPTIYHVKDGVFRKYGGGRSLQDFISFIEDKKWKDVEAIPSWKAPGSFLMGALGVLFKISMMLKHAHELLTEYYGLPAWASYTIFGISTIAVGLLLGLLIVLVTDNILGAPGEPAPVPTPSYSKEQEPGDEKAEAMEKEEEEEEEEQEEEEEEKKESSSSDSDTATIRKRVVKSAED